MKVLCLALMLALSTPLLAGANNWVPIAGDEKVTVFIDQESIRRSGNRVKIWLKWQWVKPKYFKDSPSKDSYLSERQLKICDCVSGAQALAQTTFYEKPDGGKVINSFVYEEKEWKFYESAPETIAEAIIKFACKASE